MIRENLLHGQAAGIQVPDDNRRFSILEAGGIKFNLKYLSSSFFALYGGICISVASTCFGNPTEDGGQSRGWWIFVTLGVVLSIIGFAVHAFLYGKMAFDKWKKWYTRRVSNERSAIIDQRWSDLAVRQTAPKTLHDYYKLMIITRDARRFFVKSVLKGVSHGSDTKIWLLIVKDLLLTSCEPATTKIELHAENDRELEHSFQLDVKTDIDEFEKDILLATCVESSRLYKMETFLSKLKDYHPISADEFRNEVISVINLLTNADRFTYFFTCCDGNLKSYSCLYPAPVQPAYSGVILAQFARQCAQTSAFVTTMPMMQMMNFMTMPNSFCYFGASNGREWVMNATKFKDQSIPESDLQLLDQTFEAISELFEEPEFQQFNWAGVGFQKHYSHLTITFESVKEQYVTAIKDKIRTILSSVNPTGDSFTIEETDVSFKISLRSESRQIFHKGHGIDLFVEHVKCDLANGTILVCGDSLSDVEMLEVCLQANSTGVFSIWVTTDSTLHQKVLETCASYTNYKCVFVSCLDVLLSGMAQATIREILIGRP
ncbi:putative trehalose-6-phosphate synthase 1 [Aphelenchoides besseyi]|nr:putative trehalose-6-phosphate synthase 1 [Aphelenchoides besseyi]